MMYKRDLSNQEATGSSMCPSVNIYPYPVRPCWPTVDTLTHLAVRSPNLSLAPPIQIFHLEDT